MKADALLRGVPEDEDEEEDEEKRGEDEDEEADDEGESYSERSSTSSVCSRTRLGYVIQRVERAGLGSFSRRRNSSDARSSQ